MSTTNLLVSGNKTNGLEMPQCPHWLAEELYPFQSRFVEVEGNRIHYIDEGTGSILLLVHPGVGWSFMYSDMIKELRSRFRCIALDLPGYGLSPAASGYQHTLIGDSRLLERFMQILGLTDVTLLGHDLTGSIALGVVARRPEWFRALVILPSFAWPLEGYPHVYHMIQLMGSPIFRFLGYHFNFFLEYSLRAITKKPKQPFCDREKQAYRGPNLDRAVRRYPHDLFKSVTKSHDYLADLEQRLSAIKKMPVLLIFGDVDGSIKMGWLARLERIFPRHRTIIMKGSHHFPQIYDSAAVASAIAMDAEDMVQETYLRYQATPPETIHSLKAFLTTIITRLCMDQLHLARRKRELYVGPWLPEPILTTTTAEAGDPEGRVDREESISLAFLMLLEQLQPFERAVFLLREVFEYEFAEIATLLGKTEVASRRSFSRAKKHLAEHRPRFLTSPQTHRQLLNGFVQAVENGEMTTLKNLLAEEVTLWADGGGKIKQAALRPITGRDAVARFSLGTRRFLPAGSRVEIAEINGEPAIVVRAGGEALFVLSIEVEAGHIQAIRIVANPEKLAHI